MADDADDRAVGDEGGATSRDRTSDADGLRAAHPTERAVGMAHYVSDVDGIDGRLRERPEDFRVREIERIDPEPIDADPGAYAHVVLRATLRGWDTNDFASALSDRLGISRERVHWAGTKDKRAVTTQLFSVSGIDPGALPVEDPNDGVPDDGASGDAADDDGAPGDRVPADTTQDDGASSDATRDDAPAPLRDADLEVLGRLGRSIELGDLAGNEFAVTVADPERPENVAPITASLAAFGRDEGSDGSEASAPEGDEPVSVAVPNVFGQQRFGSRRPITHEVGLAIVRRDWRDAVCTYVAEDYESEPESTREARRAAGDCVADGDLQGALDAMPNRLGYERAMLHDLAEQAADSESAPLDYRAALDALPENLQRLFVHAAQSYAFNRIVSRRLERGLPFARPVEGDVVCFADADAPEGLVLPDTDRTQRVTADRVETVTRHCERDRAFVTAPLVGTDTELGDGEPGEIERTVLEELDLAPQEFDLPDPFGSTGTRRAILVRTDLAIDRGPTDGGRGRDAGSTDGPTFEFALPKGSYATVLLREFLKGDPVDLG